MNRTGKDGPRVLRTRSGWPARRSWKVQTPPDPAELLRVGTTRGPFMVSTHVHPQVCALHEPDRQGRTAGPPDPQRLAGEEILESPNALDPAELLRVGTTRGPFMVLTHVHLQVFPTHAPYRQGRTAGPPDPQRLAGKEILESPNAPRPCGAAAGGDHPRSVHGLNSRPSAAVPYPCTGQARTDRGSSGPAAAGLARRSWKVQTPSTLRSCCGWGPPAVRSLPLRSGGGFLVFGDWFGFDVQGQVDPFQNSALRRVALTLV